MTVLLLVVLLVQVERKSETAERRRGGGRLSERGSRGEGGLRGERARVVNEGDRVCLAAATHEPPLTNESTVTHSGCRGASAAVGSSSAGREGERE